MKVYMGSDHAGYAMKKVLHKYLEEKGMEVLDLGVFDEVNSVDYPDIAREVGEKVIENEGAFGVLICGTGIGMGIAANKVKGIRAATVHDATTARLAREHNNANIVAFGQRIVGNQVAKEILDAFFASEFQGGRHGGRVEKITAIEHE